MITLRGASIAALLATSVLSAQDIQFCTVEPTVVEQRFLRLRPKNDQRAESLRRIFAEAGCNSDSWTEQKIKRSKLSNLICTLPGTSERSVIVSAHYDKVDEGEGAIDNWSGAALLPSLYQSLSNVPRTLTYVFLLTTDEEKGLIGSTGFVRSLSKEQLRAIVADVNIDSVGFPGATNVWHRRADPALFNAAVLVAGALKIPMKGVNVDQVGDSDSHPFADKHVPVIDFHSLTSATLPILHTPKDVVAIHDPASYYETFRLISAFVAYLDVAPPPAK